MQANSHVKRMWWIWMFLWMAFVSATSAGELFTAEYTAPAPADYVLESAIATGTVSGEVATLQIAVTVRVLREGWVDVPILTGKLSVIKADLGDAKAGETFLRRRGETLSLISSRPGTFRLNLSVACNVKERDGQRSVSLPLAKAIAASTTLVLPAENVRFTTTPPMDAAKEDRKDGTSAITLYGAPADTVVLTWSAQPKLADLKPLVFADHSASAEVGRGSLRLTSVFRYRVLQGTVQRLQVSLAKGTNLLSVAGDGIRRWDTTASGGAKSLTVELAEPIQERYTLTLVTEAALGELPKDVELSLPQAENVQREKGSISVLAQKGIKVEPGESEGVTQVDVSEIHSPSTVRLNRRSSTAASAADLAFRFLTRPVAVRVRVSPVRPKVTAGVTTLVTASQESLRSQTMVNYDIREAGVFRFRFALPEGMKLLDVRCPNLNTWQIEKQELVVDLRTKAEGLYALQLESEQAVKSGLATVLPIRLLDVDRETGHVAITARKGTKVELATRPGGGAVQIDVPELPAWLQPKDKPIELGFRYIRHPFELKLKIGEVQPEVHVTSVSYLTLEEHEQRLETQLTVDIRKSGIFELRLAFPKELRLSDDIKGPEIEDWRKDEAAEELIITFKGKVSGEKKILIRAERPASDMYKGVVFPRVVCKDVKKETGYLGVGSPLAVRLMAPAQGHKGLNPIPVSEHPAKNARASSARQLALAFKFLKPDWELKLDVEKIEPVVNATVVSRVELSSNLEKSIAQIRYEIKQAGTDTFYLEFPKGARSIDIQGMGIKERGRLAADALAGEAPPSPERGERWRVVLQKKVQGDYLLLVSFERGLEGSDNKAQIKYQGLRALQVQREEGYVALAANTNVEVMPSKTENVYRIDVSQIPFQSLVTQGAPAIWAFQYISHPYRVGIDVTKHEDVNVLTAVANVMWVETVVGRDGQATTDIFLVMRNNNQQHLRLKTPGNVKKIWEAKVNAEEVALAEDKEGWTLIPIAAASQSGQEFQVTLRYEQHFGKLGQWGGLDLQAPALSIPVLRCLWDVYLPEEYNLVNVGGDMTEIPAKDEGTIVAYYKQNRRALEQRVEQERLSRMAQQTAKTNIARSVRSQGAAGRSLNTGEAPTSGKVIYRFEKTMALDVGENNATVPPATLRVTVMRNAFNTVLILLLGLGGLVAIVYTWPRPLYKRVAALGGTCFFFLIIGILWTGYYPDQVLICGVAAALGLLASLFASGYGVFSVWHEARRKTRAEERRQQLERAGITFETKPATPKASEKENQEQAAGSEEETQEHNSKPDNTTKTETTEETEDADEETSSANDKDEDEEEKA